MITFCTFCGTRNPIDALHCNKCRRQMNQSFNTTNPIPIPVKQNQFYPTYTSASSSPIKVSKNPRYPTTSTSQTTQQPNLSIDAFLAHQASRSQTSNSQPQVLTDQNYSRATVTTNPTETIKFTPETSIIFNLGASEEMIELLGNIYQSTLVILDCSRLLEEYKHYLPNLATWSIANPGYKIAFISTNYKIRELDNFSVINFLNDAKRNCNNVKIDNYSAIKTYYFNSYFSPKSLKLEREDQFNNYNTL